MPSIFCNIYLKREYLKNSFFSLFHFLFFVFIFLLLFESTNFRTVIIRINAECQNIAYNIKRSKISGCFFLIANSLVNLESILFLIVIKRHHDFFQVFISSIVFISIIYHFKPFKLKF